MLCCFISQLWISDSFYSSLYIPIMLISIFFLLAETVILIDLGYSWGERWKELYDQGETVYGNLLVAFTVLVYLAVFVMLGIEFSYFKGASNVAVIVVFLIAGFFKGNFSPRELLDYDFGH